MLRPRTPNAGVCFPDFESILRRLDASRYSGARKAATLKDATDPSADDVRGPPRKFRENWGHFPGHQLNCILVGAEGANERLLDFSDDVAGSARRARRLIWPSPECSRVAHGGLVRCKGLGRPPFLDEVRALRAMDVCSKYSLSARFFSATLGECKAPLRILGFRLLADFERCGWARAGSGGMDLGRIVGRVATVGVSPRGRILTRGFRDS